MSGPQGFTPGTETRITYLDGSTWEFIILGWKEQGIVAETKSGGRIHFIPFNSVMSMSVEKPQVSRVVIGDYVSEASHA